MKYGEAEGKIDLFLQILKFLNGAKKNGISHKWGVYCIFPPPGAGAI